MSAILEEAELFASKIIISKFSNKLVYNNIDFQLRMMKAIDEIGQAEHLTQKELEIVKLAGWFMNLGFIDLDKFKAADNPKEIFTQCRKSTIPLAEKFLDRHKYPQKDQVIETIMTGRYHPDKETKLGNVLADAATSDYSKPKANARIKNLYQQFVLLGVLEPNQEKWLEAISAYLKEHRYKTKYGQEVLEPLKNELLLKVQKNKKKIQKTKDNIISKELQITEGELKKLKKSLTSVQGRDDRGIQTMFRTTSRNHYTLNQMVDRKANIMISINAIILSLIIGRMVGQTEVICIHNSPVLLMLLFSLGSILYAVAAIRPVETHGSFTRDDVNNNKGNLLYFGNYHKMSFEEYEWGMLEMINNGDHLYTTMIRDIYYLGKTLDRKFRSIRKSLTLFMIGFALSVILFLIVAPLYGMHL